MSPEDHLAIRDTAAELHAVTTRLRALSQRNRACGDALDAVAESAWEGMRTLDRIATAFAPSAPLREATETLLDPGQQAAS